MNRIKKAKWKDIIVSAKMVPVDEKSKDFYGKMKGTIHYNEDITKPGGDKWDADR